MKIALNKDFGGFSLSEKACERLECTKYAYNDTENRTASELIEIIEELGEEANGPYANIKIVEIPDESTDYTITDYDGIEEIIYVLDGKLHWR